MNKKKTSLLTANNRSISFQDVLRRQIETQSLRDWVLAINLLISGGAAIWLGGLGAALMIYAITLLALLWLKRF